MRTLDHAHLIKAIAAYERGQDRCFIFPWARGGNLQHFWDTQSGVHDKSLVSWVLEQMTGISKGICELHEMNVRHGDLKPENILHFTDEQGTDDRGRLVVADVGLAKFHPEYTRQRNIRTTTKHGSRAYEPPEVGRYGAGEPVSRKYDIWSLGCVFLEFAIWIHYGSRRLNQFQNELRGGDLDRFWISENSATDLSLHPTAKASIDKMLKSDLQPNSSLWELVLLVNEKLLVIDVDSRIRAKPLVAEMTRIERQYVVDQSYLPGLPLQGLTENRDEPDDANEPIGHLSKEVS